MEKKREKSNKRFGLIGKNISYSFSRNYFTQKFQALGLNQYSYQNFDLDSLSQFPEILSEHPDIKGLNVTIPYKEKIIPYLYKVHKTAKSIGAVNTIKFGKKGLIGYNTDHYGFKKSIKPHLKPHHKKALILGTGGASKAIKYALNKMEITFLSVSRTPNAEEGIIGYHQINDRCLATYTVIINCTPLGTFPNISEKPELPYHLLGKQHLLFDLVYNPEETTFMRLGREQGARCINGLAMLEQQAEKAWKIWNS